MGKSKRDHEVLQPEDEIEKRNGVKSKKRKHEVQSNEPDVDGNAAEVKLSKEERREAKRLKKLQKKAEVNVSCTNEDDKIINDKEEDSKAEAKALKAKKKAQKKSRKRDDTTQETDAPDKDAEASGAVSKPTKINKQENASYTENATLAALPQSSIDSFLNKHHIIIRDPSSSATPLRPIIDFSYLPTNPLPTGATSPFASFKTPTPIQAAAWPHLFSGRDVIGVAETGSGKTLAFGVPCIRSIISSIPINRPGPPCRAVIVSPTRELAVQIQTQIEAVARSASLKSVCVYGGVPKDSQRLDLKTAAIIVATPGRLNDLLEEGSADLSRVKYVVLDEADRMLDKGFEDPIRQIISRTPAVGRQTLMFTATWPPTVRDLASTFLQNPVHISLSGADNPTNELRANKSITQRVEVITPYEKEPRLLQLLNENSLKTKNNQKSHQNQNIKRILIFALYKKEAARLSNLLHYRNISAAAIHGDLSQPARSAALESFKTGECPILVATDVAARGLDIPDIELVINYTFPLTVEDYVHRIGRTGRAGKEGLAVTLFTENEKGLAGGLVNVLRAAGQEVPEDLLKFGTTVKKKGHDAYGAFYRDVGDAEKKAGTKIKFD